MALWWDGFHSWKNHVVVWNPLAWCSLCIGKKVEMSSTDFWSTPTGLLIMATGYGYQRLHFFTRWKPGPIWKTSFSFNVLIRGLTYQRLHILGKRIMSVIDNSWNAAVSSSILSHHFWQEIRPWWPLRKAFPSSVERWRPCFKSLVIYSNLQYAVGHCVV